MRRIRRLALVLALTVPGPVVAEGGVQWATPATPGVPLAENFDGVTPPALPYGWVATNALGEEPPWATSAASPDTAPNAAFLSTKAAADERLDSPPVWIATSSAQLWFRHAYSFAYSFPSVPEDDYFTTGSLEVSMNGGEFQDILEAGGSFLAGGYATSGTWVGTNGYPSYAQVVASLPTAAAGTVVVLRWHMVGGPGPSPKFPPGARWLIDSMQICDGYPCDAAPHPALLRVDEAHNGVWEPGETVGVEPGYINDVDSTVTLTGTASSLTGSSGAAYSIADPAAYYEIGPGLLGTCADTGDCYALSVDDPATRPAFHWDADFRETLDNGLGVSRRLHIGESFPDVTPSDPFYRFVEDIFHNGVTGGCSGGGYCPGTSTLRKQMSVFVLKARLGRSYVPPPCIGVFTDVTCPGTFTDWIEDLYARGIVAGCGPGPAYCPDDPVSRQQMAVFLLKTREGPAYVPPACQGVFADVPCASPFAPWIEDLASRQIAAGCGGGNYCPANATTRGQMAAFVVKTFGLLLYGP